MALHLELHVGVIRSTPVAFGDDLTCGILVTRTGPHTALLSMAMGSLSRKDMRDLCSILIGQGIHEVEMFRKKGRKVPRGVLVDSGPVLDKYRINLLEI